MTKAKEKATSTDIELDSPTGDSDTAFADLAPKPSHRVLFWAVMALIVVIATMAVFSAYYRNKIYPGVSVNGIYLGGMTQIQAKTTLEKALANYQSQTQIPIEYNSTTLAIDMSDIDLKFDIDSEVEQAYHQGRQIGVTERLHQIARSIIGRSTKLSQFNYDDAKLVPFTKSISDGIDTPVSNANLNFGETGRVAVVAEKSGVRLDAGLLVLELERRIAAGSADTITAPTYELKPTITAANLETLKAQADKYLAAPLAIKYDNVTKTSSVPVKDMIGWLKLDQAPPSLPQAHLTVESFAYRQTKAVSLGLSDSAIASYVAGLAKSVDQSGQNAALTIEDGKVTVFQPSKTGYTLDQPAAVTAIKTALAKSEADRNVTLAVKKSDPAVTEGSLNTLGINELLASGTTNFPGSPRDRLTNIRVGASKLNGVLVPPGGIFSAGANLGDIDGANGFVPAIVITANKEELQYGGGLCQVTSTAFRAALLAGLPIVQRAPHSFAVGYYTAPYGVPGTDAAINYPALDFKFKNDTPGYILIQTRMVGTSLTFDFYGTKTKTGRINNPYFVNPAGGVGWNATVPSDTIFTRDVLDLSGKVIKTDTFKSHYQSSNDFPLVKSID